MTGRVEVATIEQALALRQPMLLGRQPGERAAAVAAVVRDRPSGAEVLLIRRAARDGDPWSGHMAFPGGRAEPADHDLQATARRETREEVGLDLGRFARSIGRLDDVPAIARGRRVGLTISPFVFALLEEPPLVHNEEVEELLWAPLDPLLSGAAATSIKYAFEGHELTLPALDVRGRVVWGLTYRMLESLFEALRASPATTAG
ncbi:MAG: CoA pyrophosphatase [Sorangiineae bacterium]|nr:CoA pyrophosphatase [Polyangiaceae bacterium]MEB2324166.1 CoA pyrophosphatase [Sorangiineae bacterium]